MFKSFLNLFGLFVILCLCLRQLTPTTFLQIICTPVIAHCVRNKTLPLCVNGWTQWTDSNGPVWPWTGSLALHRISSMLTASWGIKCRNEIFAPTLGKDGTATIPCTKGTIALLYAPLHNWLSHSGCGEEYESCSSALNNSALQLRSEQLWPFQLQICCLHFHKTRAPLLNSLQDYLQAIAVEFLSWGAILT